MYMYYYTEEVCKNYSAVVYKLDCPQTSLPIAANHYYLVRAAALDWAGLVVEYYSVKYEHPLGMNDVCGRKCRL